MSINCNHSAWTPDYFTENEKACLLHLQEDGTWNSIPLLNAMESQYLENTKLVRFRGMIQDMHDMEFYFEQYEVVHQETKQTYMRNGRYKDIVQYGENEVINIDSSKNITKERSTYVVISVPGLNTWAETLENQQNTVAPLLLENSSNKSTKRSLHNEEQMEVESTTSHATSNNENKRLCTNERGTKEETNFSHKDILNYPLPKRTGKTCIIKMYKDSETLKLNQTIEFVGFLSLDPSLGQFNSNEFENDTEIQVHNPPPSLVPRIHCIGWRNLEHNNPLLHVGSIDNTEMQRIQKELLFVLTQLLLGDELAAEYLICHLISKVYLRSDMLALGKFALNISNIPNDKHPNYGRQLYEFLEILLPKSHYLAMTLENLSEMKFIPQKNYEYNRLNSGLLQLSHNTHLVLDETKLTPGRLNGVGVQNIKALSNVIRNQKADYDFNFYQMEFDCDIPFLILSEGKSLLPSDFLVPLQPDEDLNNIFPETVDAVKVYLKPELLDDIRRYLTYARHSTYELPGGVQEIIEEEFVKMRKAKKATAEDLHNLLVLARLKCLAEGKTSFDEDCWQKACQMESARKERINALKT